VTARITKAERREKKQRKRMPVTGKHVFKLQKLMSRSVAHGTGRGGKDGYFAVRSSHRIHKPTRRKLRGR
jgi:hypothetical protein